MAEDPRTAALAALKKHGTVSAAARALGIPRSTFQNRIWSTGHKPNQRNAEVTRQRLRKGVAEFRAAHDKAFIVPARLKAALAELGDAWEYEAEFLREAGVSNADISTFRDEFVDNIVVIDRNGKRVWCGTKALANKLRSMVR